MARFQCFSELQPSSDLAITGGIGSGLHTFPAYVRALNYAIASQPRSLRLKSYVVGVEPAQSFSSLQDMHALRLEGNELSRQAITTLSCILPSLSSLQNLTVEGSLLLVDYSVDMSADMSVSTVGLARTLASLSQQHLNLAGRFLSLSLFKH